MRSNKKGFSLIEMMVVVGIIGVLTTIAVPNFMRFTAKAKQTHAKTELSTIYGTEKAFFTEFGVYHPNLIFIGYTPDGAKLDANGCPQAGASNWPVRYYAVGFPATGVAATVPGVTTVPCSTGSGATYATVFPRLDTAGALKIDIPSASAMTPATDFVIGAAGKISSKAANDEWTMDSDKVLTNTVVGY